MVEVVKVVMAFTLIIVLVRLKWPLGYAMLVSAAGLAVMKGVGPRGLGEILWLTLSERSTIALAAILTLITAFSAVLRESGLLDRLTGALKQLARSTRLVAIGLPALIGLLPMPGGAAFSAPMVESAFEGVTISSARKAFTNYWFRHVWEYAWPLYPGVILTVELTGYPLSRFVLYQLPMSLTAILAGMVIALRRIPSPSSSDRGTGEGKGALVRQLLISVLPILVVILLAVGLGVHLVPAFVAGTILSLWIGYRNLRHPIGSVLLKSLSLNTVVLVVGIMAFKETLEYTHIITSMANAFHLYGIPPVLLFIVVPFIVGMVSGLTAAFVGVAFPILFPLVSITGDGIGYVVLAYAAGFAGVMLSPVHLCFVLSKEYFETAMGSMYRLIVIPAASVIAAAGAICAWMVR